MNQLFPSAAIGPFVGGALVQYADWRWIFLLNLPLAVVTVVVARRWVPETLDPHAPERFDAPGAVLAAVALGGTTYALIEWGDAFAPWAAGMASLAAIGFVVVERTSSPGRHANWTAFGFGCIAGAVPWIAITVALVGAEADGDVPGFVYGIFVSLFLFFNSFAVNMVLQYRCVDPWRSYRFGEAAYVGLSLAAKSALAWQVFAGTLAG